MTIMTKCFGRGVFIVAVAMLAVPGAAWGVISPELRCQQTAASAGLKLFRDTLTALKSCEDSISRGALPLGTDCTEEAKAKAKIINSEHALSAKLASACTNTVVASLAACGGFAGACAGKISVADLYECLKESHEGAAIELNDLPYHAPALLTPHQRRCQKTLAAKAVRMATTRLSNLQACKKEITLGILPPGTNCLTTSASVKLTQSSAQAAARVGASCPSLVLSSLPLGTPCGGVGDGASAAACAFCAYTNAADKLLLIEYGRGPTGSGPAAKAYAQQIVSDTDVTNYCIGGPLSRCRANDYILKNDRIRVVVQNVQRNLFGIGQFGGQIIDADLVRTPPDPDRDNFEEWSTSVNIENTAHYTSVMVVNDGTDGNPAVIRATGPDDLLDFLNPSSIVAGLGYTFPPTANDRDLPVVIVTDYILEPGKNYARVETTVTNTGGTPLNIFFGEFLNGSGQLQLFQPVLGFGEPMATWDCPTTTTNKCDFVAYAGRDAAAGVSYGYVQLIPGSTTFTTSGVTVPQLGVNIMLALLGIVGPPFDIAAADTAGDSLAFTRYFVVGNGTVSSITDARNELECIATGTLTGTVTAGGVPRAGVDVAILGSTSRAEIPYGMVIINKNVVTHTQTDSDGRYSLTLPPGDFTVAANLTGYPFEGSTTTPTEHPVTIQLYTTTTQDIALPATGALRALLTDETGHSISGKVSVVGFDPSPDPANIMSIFGGKITTRTGVFGEHIGGSPDVPIDGLPFGVAKVIYLDEDGDSGTVALEPGGYQVVVSHGPEYSIATQDITVTAGSTSTVNAQIAHVVNSTGLVASDFHVHSINSADSKVSKIERVRTMRAEGVDFFTPSDHDFRSDFMPTIAEMGIRDLICTATSGEITTFDYGHFNAWPMLPDTSKVNGGSVDWAGAVPTAGEDFPSFGNYGLTPEQIIDLAHADAVDGQSTVQINHMYTHFGLQSGNGLAIDTGATPWPQSASSAILSAAKRLDPDVSNYFSDRFDALEVWIGEDRNQVFNNMYNVQDPSHPVSKLRGGTLGDWFNMINRGIVRTGVADSDTHRQSLTQAGTPRTMVAATTDQPCEEDPLQAEFDALSASVNAGRAIGTNAPIVRVTAHASSPANSAALERRCVGASPPCTDTASCPPCSDTCGSGVCTLLPTLISTSDGKVDITVDVQSPVWAEFDTIEFYVNPTTKQFTIKGEQTGAGKIDVNHYGVIPYYVATKGTDFTVTTVDHVYDPPIPGAQHLKASYTLSLTDLSEDTWVVVIVRGTDGVSKPLFPVIPNDLERSTNTTLTQLTTNGNLGEDGMTALAFTNPLFIDVDDGDWTAPGVNFGLCEDLADTCTFASECCSGMCTSGACCLAATLSCTSGSECCSGTCTSKACS